MAGLFFALVAAALLLLFPTRAFQGARDAMWLWATAVAPALFPFLAVLPALGTDAARRFLRKRAAWITRPLSLPGDCAAVIVVGMLAGSPAGALLASRMSGEMDRGDLARVILPVCGVSPGFLVTGVGVGMLGSARAGYILAASHAAAEILLLVVLSAIYRREGKIYSPAIPPGEKTGSPSAVMAILSVCGAMALFGSFARVIGGMVGEAGENLLMYALDFPTGVARAAQSGVSPVWIAAMAGFSGCCILYQNGSILRRVGILWTELLAAKICCACLSMMIAGSIFGAWPFYALYGVALFASIFASKQFLYKRNCRKTREKIAPNRL